MQFMKMRLRSTIFYAPLKKLWEWHNKPIRWYRKMRFFRRMRRFYAQFIKPGDLVFDVGANVGSRTRVFLELGARVVAVEPQKECARVLYLSFSPNPNFYLVNKALGSANTTSEMFISNKSVAASLSSGWVESKKPKEYASFSWSGSRQVLVTTLDTLIEAHGQPVFVKIDTEAFEYEVMRGLSRPLTALSFEFNIAYLEPALQSIDYLQQFGSLEFNYAIGECFEWMLKEWVTSDEMISILKKYRASTEFSYGDVYVRFGEK